MKQKTDIRIGRRRALAGLAGLCSAPLLSKAAWAQGDGVPVKFIIASTPGTGPDTMSRLIQPQLQARWNRPVIVDNKPGAGGVIGIEAVAKSPPDGNTLMLQTSTMFLLPYFYKQIPFDPLKSFSPITQVGWSTFALVVNSNVPATTLPQLVEWIKKSGSSVNYASPGKGTENHLFAEIFKLRAGVEMTHVPYRGAAPAIQDVMGGVVPLMFLPIATAATHAKSGRIRIIGCTSKERFPLMKDIPSLAEQGLPGFDFSVWYGIWGPAGMSAETVARYNDDLRAILLSPEITGKFGDNGWAVKVGTPQELDALGRQQFARWREVIAETKVDTSE